MDVYSLENAIRSFFDGDVSPSQNECDEVACSLLGGGPVVPFPIQGQFSYTVFSPHVRPGKDGSGQSTLNAKIVQFRLNHSRIDIYLAQLAKAIHGDIAAETEYQGEIGQEEGRRFAVYVIQKLPGVPYIEVGSFSVEMNQEQASRQLKMIKDFARYGGQVLDINIYEPFPLTRLKMLGILPFAGSSRNRSHKASEKKQKPWYLISFLFLRPLYLLDSPRSCPVSKKNSASSLTSSILRSSHMETFVQ